MSQQISSYIPITKVAYTAPELPWHWLRFRFRYNWRDRPVVDIVDDLFAIRVTVRAKSNRPQDVHTAMKKAKEKMGWTEDMLTKPKYYQGGDKLETY